MTKDNPKKQSNDKLSPKEREFLAKVESYKSNSDTLKSNYEQSLQSNNKKSTNSEVKFTDKVKNVKNLITDKEGPNVGIRDAVKKYVKEQPIDAAVALAFDGPKGAVKEAIGQKMTKKIDQQSNKSAVYEKIIKDIKYAAGERDPFADLKRKYEISSQNSRSNQNQNKSIPNNKGKSSSYER